MRVSMNKLRDELLNREVFYSLQESNVLIGNWRKEYNSVRPHSSIDYKPPAPKAFQSLIFNPFWFISDRENVPPVPTKMLVQNIWAGHIFGDKIIPEDDIRSIRNVIAVEDSFQLNRSAMFLETLNKGKVQEVINILSAEIKGKLDVDDKYRNFQLPEDIARDVKESRQKAKTILERYSNQKISETLKSSNALERTGKNSGASRYGFAQT